MKTNLTPTKTGINENSCEITSQTLGDPFLKNSTEPYKRACSGFGCFESIN